MATSITANITRNVIETDDGLFRLQVYVSETESVPQELFVMRSLPSMPGVTDSGSTFERVCVYADLINYRTVSDTGCQIFRSGKLDLLFPSRSTLEEFYLELSAGIIALCDDVQSATDAAITTAVSTLAEHTITFSTKVGDPSVLARITITPLVAQESALFLISKPANVLAANDPCIEELIAVCSPEDTVEYDTVEIYPGYYRTNAITVAANSSAKYAAFKAALLLDLTNVSASIGNLEEGLSVDVTVTCTSDTSTYFTGDPFVA